MGEIGFLSRNAMAEPRCEIRGFPQAFTMDNMVRASLAISGENPSESSIPSSHSRKLVALMGDVGQLTKELAAPYLDYFIHKIGLMFLYIDPLELRRFFDDHFCEKRSRFNNNSNTGSRVTTPFQDFYVYMAVSIGMLLSSEPCIELFARTLHSAAMEKFSVMLKDRDSLKTLHSIFLLIIYSIYSPSGGSTWHLLGLARNQSVSLRLHREPHPGCGISSEELTSRRNFFWSLYTLDRLVYTSISMIHQRLKLPPSTISCAMDRPFSIQDNDISLQVRQAVLVLVGLEQYLNLKQFPARDSPSISAVDFDFACHMITHARLMSSIRASSPGNPVFHYGNLSYWRDLAKSGTNQVHDGDISSGYVGQLTCRALIHIAQLSRCAVSAGSLIGKTQTIEQDAIGSCHAYIDNEFCRFEKGDFAKSFVDGFDIFAAGVVVICLPLGSRLPGRPGDVSTINKCTALLTSIGERFPAFKILYRVLWALFAVASDGTSSDGVRPITLGSISSQLLNYGYDSDASGSPGSYTRWNANHDQRLLPTIPCGDLGLRISDSCRTESDPTNIVNMTTPYLTQYS